MSPRTIGAYRKWASTLLDASPVVSVVVPAYNEQERIVPTIGAIAAYMCGRGEPWELIVADDGSTDDTVALLRELDLPNVRILEAVANGGKGSAVRRGMAAARGQFVLFADADQSTPIEQFDLALATLIEERLDVVVGSRAAQGASVTGKSRLRRTLSWGLHKVVRLGFGIRIRDTQCGFKIFTAPAAQKLFAVQVVDGFSFDLELIYLAGRMGMRVGEIPVEWHDAPGSTVDATKVALRFLRDLVSIRLRDLRGGYRTAPARLPDEPPSWPLALNPTRPSSSQES